MDTITEPQIIFEVQRAMEESRQVYEAATQKRQTKLEMVRLAKEVLAENARHQTTEFSGVTAAAVIAFAQELNNYVDG